MMVTMIVTPAAPFEQHAKLLRKGAGVARRYFTPRHN
jgi:hypothetical protein